YAAVDDGSGIHVALIGQPTIAPGSQHHAARLYAFAAAASFLGASTYIGLVEQPARLALSGAGMLREWKWSNWRGTLVLSVFAVVSAILAYIQFKTNGDVRWLIGGTIILASWPYGYFVMMPLNV